MPTTKQRINITADSSMESALKSAAKRDNMSIASKAVELLRLALEIEEDHVLASIAIGRDTKNIKPVSHDALWNKVMGK